MLKLIQDTTHREMFWIEWPDGVRSKDYYNYSRAKQHLEDIQQGLELDSCLKAQGSPLVSLNDN